MKYYGRHERQTPPSKFALCANRRIPRQSIRRGAHGGNRHLAERVMRVAVIEHALKANRFADAIRRRVHPSRATIPSTGWIADITAPPHLIKVKAQRAPWAASG